MTGRVGITPSRAGSPTAVTKRSPRARAGDEPACGLGLDPDDIAGDAAILASLQGLRAELAELTSRLDLAQEIVVTVPHRERYLRLVRRLGRALVHVHEEWIDDVEMELAGSR